MALTNDIKEQIAIQVIRTLSTQFEKFPEDIHHNRNAPFHEAFISAFSDKLQGKVASIPIFISLSSWLHGLNTSLGQSFFENTAQILCGGEKRVFTAKKNSSLLVEQSQKHAIAKIITDLSNGNILPSLKGEDSIIHQQMKESNLVEATDFTADVFIENRNEVVCLEIKTVKPNKGVFKVEKEKLLEAKSSLKNRYPDKEIKYFLAFPFDPLSETPCGFDKDRFMGYSVGFRKYFDEAEILLGAEMWDYLSGGTQTMEEILDVINAIATPNFMSELAFLTDAINVINNKQDYMHILKKWFLFQEYDLVSKSEQIKVKLTTKKLEALYHQSCFNDGEYKWQRARTLLTLLENT